MSDSRQSNASRPPSLKQRFNLGETYFSSKYFSPGRGVAGIKANVPSLTNSAEMEFYLCRETKSVIMKFLNSKIHSAIDYFVVVLLWASPSLFGLNESVSLLTYLLGAIHLVLTVFTNFHFGIIKVIPVRVHGAIELAVAIILIISPPILGTIVPAGSLVDKYFFLGFGVVVLITWAVTDYSVEPK